ELAQRAARAREAREHAACSGFSVEPVTRATKADAAEARAYDVTPHELAPHDVAPTAARGLGPAWGRVLHRAVEAMGRGRRGDSLVECVRAVVRDERVAETEGDVERAAVRVLAALDRIRESPDWSAVAAAGSVEVPVMLVSREASKDVVLEGVADAVVRAPTGWRVLDWKTD